MKLLKEETHIDFLGKKTIASIFSAVLITISIISIIYHQGLNMGIDFRGGYQIRIQFENAIDEDQLRDKFSEIGMTSIALQRIGEGNEIKLMFPLENPLGNSGELKQGLKDLLEKDYPISEFRSIDLVGPQVGDELFLSAVYAVLIALSLILVYITFRFHWKFGVSAILTLSHDVIIVLGFISIFDKEFTLTILAALLTIVGYSLNDTIVVFDRIRESMARFRKKTLGDVINLSINETLSRTLLTSGTTLFVVLALFFLGGEILNGFAFGMLIGVVIGTYSSIYVASPLLIYMSVKAPVKQQSQSA